jgi:hypothetical protein
VSPGADDFGHETMKWQNILPHSFGILTNSSISLLRQIRVRDYPSRCASTPLRRLCNQADRRRWNAHAVVRRPMPCSARTRAAGVGARRAKNFQRARAHNVVLPPSPLLPRAREMITFPLPHPKQTLHLTRCQSSPSLILTIPCSLHDAEVLLARSP